MNRGDLQELSNLRIREAKILLNAGQYSGAYYLAGYSVECALKACFAKAVKRYDFPDKTSVRRVFVHNLADLIDLANLKKSLQGAAQANSRLESAWDTVSKWNEESRYAVWSKNDAEVLIDAIVRRRDGGTAMDQTTLVGPDVSAGSEAIAALDSAGVRDITALLVLLPEYGDWRLVLSSPSLDQNHLLKAQERVSEILGGRFVYRLPPKMVFRTKDPFIRDLHRMYGKAKDVAGMRLGPQTIGGRFIEGAYIYRIA